MKKYSLSVIVSLFFVYNAISQPTRVWGTYFGGAQDDVIRSIANAPNGDVLVCGYTTSTANIATLGSEQQFNAGLEDGFLARFDSAGALLWATYFGGPDVERAISLCLDASGNIYISGRTSSSISISTPGSHQAAYGDNTDAFLAKYNGAGVLQWATYYGGSNYDGAVAVAVDGAGNVYMTGGTTSTNNISTAGSHQFNYGGTADGFLVKFNSAGVRQWATYYGGTMNDGGAGVCTDAIGCVYITGTTESSNAISTPGSHQPNPGGAQTDGFLAKFDGSGLRLWATYYGGSLQEDGRAVATDQSGNVYLAGQTSSTNNITTPGCHQSTLWVQDAFLVKFNSSGVRQWGTYYGGSAGGETAYSLSIDTFGNVFMCGVCNSLNGISTPGSHQPTWGGGFWDSFAVKFSSAGVRQWGTYYGGTLHDYGFSMCMDQSGNIYLGGVTSSTNAISTAGSYQFVWGGGINQQGGGDGYLVRFADCGGPPDLSIVGPTVVCVGAGPTVYSVAPGALSYTWSLPAGWSGSSSTNTISATPGSSGVFSVTGSNWCGTGSQTLNVTVSGLPTITVNSGTICSGNSFTMIPSGASTYTFQGGSAVVSPTTTTSYTVIGADLNGCVSQTVASSVTVNALPLPTITVNSGSICLGNSFTIVPSGANTYTFIGGGPIVSPTVTTSYSVSGTSSAGCISSGFAVSNVTVNATPDISVSSSSSLICIGETATLTATGTNSYSWSTGSNTSTTIVSPTVTTTYTLTGTNLNGCQKTVTITQVVSPCTALEKNFNTNSTSVSVFPNPTSGELNIQFNSFNENTAIEIYNVLGELVLKTNPTRSSSIIKADQLSKGIYQIRITQSGHVITRVKIVRE